MNVAATEGVIMEQQEAMRSRFRDAMSRLGAAVNVITSHGAGGPCGITATAVCSVSDSPPTVLICLNRTSALNAVFRGNGVVCINVLAAHQEPHARHFAGMTGLPMRERFADSDWVMGNDAVPSLRSALANLHGRITQTMEVGSHTVMFVEIEKIDVPSEQNGGLVYFNRAFHRIAEAAVA
jgi:flavin reductase (NADH)